MSFFRSIDNDDDEDFRLKPRPVFRRFVNVGLGPVDFVPEAIARPSRSAPPSPAVSAPAASEAPPDITERPLSDEEGLDRAYQSDSNLYFDEASGVLYVAGTKGSFTDKEWIENLAVYGPPLVANAMGVKAPYPIESHGRYSQLQQYMEANGSKVRALVGHSKGASVIHRFQQQHTQYKNLPSRLYATPHEDVMGVEKYAARPLADYNKARAALSQAGLTFRTDPFETYVTEAALGQVGNLLGVNGIVPNERRIANVGDPAAILDSSAERYVHPDPMKYLASGGPHDYHMGPASWTSGVDGSVDNVRPGGVDINYRALGSPSAAAAEDRPGMVPDKDSQVLTE